MNGRTKTRRKITLAREKKMIQRGRRQTGERTRLRHGGSGRQEGRRRKFIACIPRNYTCELVPLLAVPRVGGSALGRVEERLRREMPSVDNYRKSRRLRSTRNERKVQLRRALFQLLERSRRARVRPRRREANGDTRTASARPTNREMQVHTVTTWKPHSRKQGTRGREPGRHRF